MKQHVLITGTSRGIGAATALKFLDKGYIVHGFDIIDPKPEVICDYMYKFDYYHHTCDVRNPEKFPDLPPIDILINNAGTQNDDDINTNLIGTMNITERYGIHKGIKAILNNASASAHTGAEFPAYSASKGGVLSYTKNVALRVAEYGAVCNSISLGGVSTELNLPVMRDKKLWKQIMDLTPLKRWATPEEVAEWIYFLTVKNKFMTGQDVMIDGGESTNAKFVWC